MKCFFLSIYVTENKCLLKKLKAYKNSWEVYRQKQTQRTIFSKQQCILRLINKYVYVRLEIYVTHVTITSLRASDSGMKKLLYNFRSIITAKYVSTQMYIISENMSQFFLSLVRADYYFIHFEICEFIFLSRNFHHRKEPTDILHWLVIGIIQSLMCVYSCYVTYNQRLLSPTYMCSNERNKYQLTYLMN